MKLLNWHYLTTADSLFDFFKKTHMNICWLLMISFPGELSQNIEKQPILIWLSSSKVTLMSVSVFLSSMMTPQTWLTHLRFITIRIDFDNSQMKDMFFKDYSSDGHNSRYNRYQAIHRENQVVRFTTDGDAIMSVCKKRVFCSVWKWHPSF